MAKRPVFDFKLSETPRVREKADWLDVARDTRALGAAALENARVLALDHVEPGPWQVRRGFPSEKMAELVASIRAQGVLEPILVRPAAEGRYQIIAGERRYRAAREAGLTTIPALVFDLDDVNARVVSLMENIQRTDLNEVERAEGLLALKQTTGETWEAIAKLLGITRRHVLHLVSLTRLPDPVQGLLREGRLSAKHGRLLAYVKERAAQLVLAELIVELRLNAQQTAEAVKRLGSEPGFTVRPGAAGETIAPQEVRARVERTVERVLEGQAARKLPEAAVPAITAGDIQQLLSGLTEVRRAIAAFPSVSLADDAARRLRNELAALIQAAEALQSRVPMPLPE
ncbi:MAG: ParB/RepB/Spo0J family partition protein [Armatimonadetes bacterium]|nr:ParB/RepB/Spo0J family partition protein [Armatimonadota bacterium]